MNLDEDSSIPDWRAAQQSIANFLLGNSFEVWEEQAIGNRRVDVLAKREFGGKIYYLIFEVKHYQNVTSSIEESFLLQIEEYIEALLKREVKRKSPKHVFKNYIFIGYLILAKDYGIYLNRRKNWRKKEFLSDNEKMRRIWKRNVHFFCSSPKFIKANLENFGIKLYTQSKISDFITSNNNKNKSP